jgi:hypothetical protein
MSSVEMEIASDAQPCAHIRAVGGRLRRASLQYAAELAELGETLFGELCGFGDAEHAEGSALPSPSFSSQKAPPLPTRTHLIKHLSEDTCRMALPPMREASPPLPQFCPFVPV